MPKFWFHGIGGNSSPMATEPWMTSKLTVVYEQLTPPPNNFLRLIGNQQTFIILQQHVRYMSSRYPWVVLDLVSSCNYLPELASVESSARFNRHPKMVLKAFWDNLAIQMTVKRPCLLSCTHTRTHAHTHTRTHTHTEPGVNLSMLTVLVLKGSTRHLGWRHVPHGNLESDLREVWPTVIVIDIVVTAKKSCWWYL